jgi:hypothetical protein
MWGKLWGSMIWGRAAAVPALGGVLFVMGLFLALLAVGYVWISRSGSKGRRVARLWPLALLVLIAPFTMAFVPNTFTNGTVADATQVNANFTALDSRISKSNIYLRQDTKTSSSCLAGFRCPASAPCDDANDIAIGGRCIRDCALPDNGCSIGNPFDTMGLVLNNGGISSYSCATVNISGPLPFSVTAEVECLSIP